MIRSHCARLTAKQEKTAIKLYREGLRLEAIGQIIDPDDPIPESTIRSFLKRNGVHRPRDYKLGHRDETVQKIDLIEKLYVEWKWSSPKIANVLGMHDTSVRRFLRTRGVIRSKSEAIRLAYDQGRRKPSNGYAK